MKLAIIGYGKMGRLIEQLAPEYGFTAVVSVDIGDDFAKVAGSDVAIEFTAPEAVLGNIEKLAAMVAIALLTYGRTARPFQARASMTTPDSQHMMNDSGWRIDALRAEFRAYQQSAVRLPVVQVRRSWSTFPAKS